MSVTANLTTNVETITATIVVEDETIIAEINTAARGPAGADGSGSATWGGITGTLSAQTDLQTALNLKAPLASPALTGTPTAPTAVTTTSTTQLATTAFVQQELASGVAVAKNLEFLAHNGTGVTITKGSIVYINGAVSGNPRITLAQANNDTNSARTIGFAKADIANGANGFVIMEGELENVRTADADGIIGAGNQIFLSPTTPGAFTRTEPSAPNHLVYVGVITRASTSTNLDGRILVGIQNGYELEELHNVAISSPAAKQVIKRNAGNTLWVNEAIVSADVSDATSAATANTLVLRDGNGGASFGAGTLTAFALTVTGGTTFGEESLVQFDALEYYYGTGAASAHRIALGAGTTGAALFGAADAAAARTTLGLSGISDSGVSPTLYIGSAGDVSIGAAVDTTYRLQVVKNAASNETKILNSQANGYSGLILGQSGTAYVGIYHVNSGFSSSGVNQAGSAKWETGGGDTNGHIFNTTNASAGYRFYTNSTLRFTIKASGQLNATTAAIPNYANDAAADAALVSGDLYTTTAGGRTIFRKP
jgi:hypothetical protein